MTPEQLEVLLAHVKLLTRRVFDLSGTDDKIELMQSLQDLMVAVEVET